VRRLLTVGHSTRSFDEQLDVLRAWDVELLVDIRSITRSRTNPQFDRSPHEDAAISS
jgi:uncharacterized protein (DUF488 family)